MKSTNTLSSVLDNLVKLQRNNSEILAKLSDVISSEADTVEFKIEDISNDTIRTVSLPSMGGMLKNIERQDQNIKQLAGIGDSDASIKLPDGTYRTITKSTLEKSASDITNIEVPTSFNNKNNWFFESFLNPYLYVAYDFGEQINPYTKKISSQKFILNLDTDAKLAIFNDNFKGESNIEYNNFVDLIIGNGIDYALDEDIIDLPPVEQRYFGNFSVLRSFEQTEDVIVNGAEATKKRIRFQLDKLTYNDKNSSLSETQQLKKGDSLLVNKNDRNTRYFIENIDFETNTVSVILAEGYDSVNIGANNLSYYNTTPITPEVQVGVGFNEYIVQFIKPIDPDSNQPANNWSPGVGFYSTELTINDNGVIKTLDTYYNESVVDFGAHLLSIAKENIPPSSKAVTPNTVEFSSTENPEELKVVQINKHVTDVQSNEEIESLNREKNSLKSEILQIDENIKSLRYDISVKTYKTDVERQTDKNKLVSLIEERASTETLYNTTVNDIITKSNDKNTTAAAAKYRIRGFFNIPKEQTALDGSVQDIIQFIVEYRYLTKGGSANNLEEFKRFNEDGSEIQGIYSDWTKSKTSLRERLFDPSTGNNFWAPQDNENGDVVNINQLDIPIRPNESVEIRIKSISEAGYPSNPVESEYSSVIRVDFPDTLGVSKSVLEIAKEASDEQVAIKLQEDLVSKGINDHIADQFTQNDTFYAHQAFNIASGRLTPERNVISVFDLLEKMQARIDALEAQVNKVLGVLVVKIEDDLGNQQIINSNQKVSLFAGNYKDLVSDLDEPKGVILSKNYFLRIENSTATPIELRSIASGSKFIRATANQYNLPAIGLTNPSDEDINNSLSGGTAKRLPYQSCQVQGQFIFVRYNDITNTKNIYDTDSTTGDNGTVIGSFNSFSPSNLSGITTSNYVSDSNFFVWGGAQTTSTDIQGVLGTDIPDDNIYVHAEHPVLQAGIDASAINDFITSSTSVSKYAPLDREKNPSNYYKQSPFYRDVNDLTNKLSFTDDDKYLLGPKSCGCYLYMANQDYDNIRVNGNDSTSIQEVTNTSNSSVAIQLVYQFRMTDYFGPARDGIGRIAGLPNATQVFFTKMLSFDIYNDDNKFSFDIEISSRYKSNSISSSDIPTLTYQNTADALGNTVSQITPTITS